MWIPDTWLRLVQPKTAFIKKLIKTMVLESVMQLVQQDYLPSHNMDDSIKRHNTRSGEVFKLVFTAKDVLFEQRNKDVVSKRRLLNHILFTCLHAQATWRLSNIENLGFWFELPQILEENVS